MLNILQKPSRQHEHKRFVSHNHIDVVGRSRSFMKSKKDNLLQIAHPDELHPKSAGHIHVTNFLQTTLSRKTPNPSLPKMSSCIWQQFEKCAQIDAQRYVLNLEYGIWKEVMCFVAIQKYNAKMRRKQLPASWARKSLGGMSQWCVCECQLNLATAQLGVFCRQIPECDGSWS